MSFCLLAFIRIFNFDYLRSKSLIADVLTAAIHTEEVLHQTSNLCVIGKATEEAGGAN